jgi:hypothetical protein
MQAVNASTPIRTAPAKPIVQPRPRIGPAMGDGDSCADDSALPSLLLPAGDSNERDERKDTLLRSSTQP